MNLIRKSCIFLFSLLLIVPGINAQIKTSSVGLDLEDQNVSLQSVGNYVDSNYGARGLFKFDKIREYTDQRGVTHTDFQQKLNGLSLENCIIIVHSYGDNVISMNGQIATENQLEMNKKEVVRPDRAIKIAKDNLKVKSLISPKIEKLYTRYINEDGDEKYRLVYRTRVTSLSDLMDQNVYIDAVNGDVVKKSNMIMHAGEVVEVKLPTYYTGEQILRLEKDSNGFFLLKDESHQNYTLEGKAKTKITSADLDGAEMENDHDKFDSLLIAHIDYMTNNTPVIKDKDGDWDFFVITHVDFLSYVDRPNLDTCKFNYFIYFKRNGKYIGGMDYIKFQKKVPIISNLFIDIDRDSSYTCELVHKRYTGDIFNQYEDSLIYSFEFNADKDGVIEFPNKNFKGSVTIERKHNHALDVHYTIDKCYEYYLNVHNRKSFDGKNSPIYQFVDFDDGGVFPNFSSVGLNAFAWAAEPYFIATGYGDGNYSISDKFASFDLLAHEFNHLVTATNGRGGIGTSGESGAINEAIADCFGVAADFYANPKTANWQIADSVMLDSPYMRDMSDPKLKDGAIRGYMTHPQADTYGGKNWIDPNNLNMDNGGVHYNNGVFNYWFYLLTEGGSGVNDNDASYSVEGIGIKKTEQLLMNVVMNYMVPQAQFADMYKATRLAAKEMYGESSNEYAQVNNAWFAVGVDENSTTDVENVDLDKALVAYVNNGYIVVEADENERIDIYNAIGQLLISEKAQPGVNSLPIPFNDQIVIVKVGDKVQKLITK